MLIVLGLYFTAVWLIFSRLKLLPWNGFWKGTVYSLALIIALVVIGALNHTTPTGPVSVQGVATSIAPNVSGNVTEVVVEPNAELEQDDILFRIDDTVYAAEVARLEAALEGARAEADRLQTDLAAADADIEGLKVQLEFGELRRDDIIELEQRGASTTFQLQEAVATIDQLSESLRAAEARKAGLERRIAAQVDGMDAGVVEVEAALRQARWNLDQTVVRAPANGVVSGLSLRVGNHVSSSQGAVNFLVPSDRKLIATLPQSSRANVSVGDEIRIALKTVPGSEFTATIAAMPPGTAEGAVDARAALPTLRDVAGISEYLVTMDLPQDLDPGLLPLGASGTALVMTDEAGAIGVLAEILFWITKQLNYL